MFTENACNFQEQYGNAHEYDALHALHRTTYSIYERPATSDLYFACNAKTKQIELSKKNNEQKKNKRLYREKQVILKIQ